MKELRRHRAGLDAVARALLAHETVDGAEVTRLVDQAYGRPVHPNGSKSSGEVPTFAQRRQRSASAGSADDTTVVDRRPR